MSGLKRGNSVDVFRMREASTSLLSLSTNESGLSGELYKQSRSHPSRWQKRWCAWNGAKFSYYKNKDSKEPSMAIKLENIESVRRSDNINDLVTFAIKFGNNEELIFGGKKRDTTTEWIAVLNRAVNSKWVSQFKACMSTSKSTSFESVSKPEEILPNSSSHSLAKSAILRNAGASNTSRTKRFDDRSAHMVALRQQKNAMTANGSPKEQGSILNGAGFESPNSFYNDMMKDLDLTENLEKQKKSGKSLNQLDGLMGELQHEMTRASCIIIEKFKLEKIKTGLQDEEAPLKLVDGSKLVDGGYENELRSIPIEDWSKEELNSDEEDVIVIASELTTPVDIIPESPILNFDKDEIKGIFQDCQHTSVQLQNADFKQEFLSKMATIVSSTNNYMNYLALTELPADKLASIKRCRSYLCELTRIALQMAKHNFTMESIEEDTKLVTTIEKNLKKLKKILEKVLLTE